MAVEFDPAKEIANVTKHGVSLATAGELEVEAVVSDFRFGEPRLRAYGLLAGPPHCLAYTLREGRVRAISPRRSHLREYRRHVQP